MKENNEMNDMYDVDSPASSDPLLKNMKSVMNNTTEQDLIERVSSIDKRIGKHANALDNLISENKILRKKNALLERRLRESLQTNNSMEYKIGMIEQALNETFKRIDNLENSGNINYRK